MDNGDWHHGFFQVDGMRDVLEVYFLLEFEPGYDTFSERSQNVESFCQRVPKEPILLLILPNDTGNKAMELSLEVHRILKYGI